MELGEGSFVLKLKPGLACWKKCISSGMILVSKAGLPLHLLPIVHECPHVHLLPSEGSALKENIGSSL